MTLLPQLNFPGLLMTFRLQWNNSTTPWTREQITVKIYWLAGTLMSLSPLRMKTVFPFNFEGFLFSVFKNNDSHFCHLVREKKNTFLSAWPEVSPVTAKVSCHFCLIHSYAHISRTHYSLGNSILCRILAAQQRYCIIAIPNRKKPKMISSKVSSSSRGMVWEESSHFHISIW